MYEDMKTTPSYSERTYCIYDPNGRLAESRPASLRYPPKTELSILNAGYTIKLNGRRITKKETKNK